MAVEKKYIWRAMEAGNVVKLYRKSHGHKITKWKFTPNKILMFLTLFCRYHVITKFRFRKRNRKTNSFLIAEFVYLGFSWCERVPRQESREWPVNTCVTRFARGFAQKPVGTRGGRRPRRSYFFLLINHVPRLCLFFQLFLSRQFQHKSSLRAGASDRAPLGPNGYQ